MDTVEVKPYPVQSYGGVNSNAITLETNVSQPGHLQRSHYMTNFLDIVSTSPVSVIEDFVAKNSDIVHEKGFNGLLPLHRACLRGDITIVRLLLKHGARFDDGNDFDETPLHYACKRANLVVLQVLIDSGADVHREDRAGKGALHHAAHGGSILALHYLLDVCGLNPHVRDRNLNTPVHIVCIHGHVEAFNYLLRKERCDISSRDAQGNSLMHLAALNGNGWMCWRLLEYAGYKLLHDVNNEGSSPLDLAKRGSAAKYKEIVSMLSYYTRQSSASRLGQTFTGVNVVWYCLLIGPFVFYPLCLLLTSVFANRGLVMLVGLIIILAFRTFHPHRIDHVSRLPSPAHAGIFAAGMLYTLVCFYGMILPAVFDYVGYLFTILSILVAVAMLWMYVKLLSTDPGVCEQSRLKANHQQYYSIADVAQGVVGPEEFCNVCEIVQPEFSSHCRLCCKCFLQIDHHCLYLYRCIATHNHRLFVLFNMAVMSAIVLFELSCYVYLRTEYVGVDLMDWPIVWDIFATYPGVWSLLMLNAVSAVWGGWVLHTQIMAVSKGRLRAYQSYRVRSWLSKKQRFMNVVHFLLHRPPYVCDDVTVS